MPLFSPSVEQAREQGRRRCGLPDPVSTRDTGVAALNGFAYAPHQGSQSTYPTARICMQQGQMSPNPVTT